MSKKLRKILICVAVAFCLLPFQVSYAKSLNDVNIDVNLSDGNSGPATLSDQSEDSLIDGIDAFLSKYTELMVGILGIAFLTMVLIALYLFANLGTNGSNPAEKNAALVRIGGWAVSAAILGSLTLWVSIAYNAFQ